jgi:hypothetical protein
MLHRGTFWRKLICLKNQEELSFEVRETYIKGNVRKPNARYRDTILVVNVPLAASTYAAVGDKMLA